MEIKNIVNNVENAYPKMEQISKKHLSNNIPSKWLKIGLSSLEIALLTNNKTFAVSNLNFTTIDIAGGAPAPITTPLPVEICNIACPTVQIVSAVVFIITGLSILLTKIKAKKQSEPKKVKKWIKILFIISIVVFILSILTTFIINTIDYY